MQIMSESCFEDTALCSYSPLLIYSILDFNITEWKTYLVLLEKQTKALSKSKLNS